MQVRVVGREGGAGTQAEWMQLTAVWLRCAAPIPEEHMTFLPRISHLRTLGSPFHWPSQGGC